MARRFPRLAGRCQDAVAAAAGLRTDRVHARPSGGIVHRTGGRKARRGASVIWQLVKRNPVAPLLPFLAVTYAVIWWFVGGVGGVSQSAATAMASGLIWGVCFALVFHRSA